MNDNSKSRKFMLTINNPEDHGLTREDICTRLKLLPFQYACLAYEIGELGTEHVHIYIYSPVTIRFSRIKNVFPIAHIEAAHGSHTDNRDYITKSGKWVNSEKETTNLKETFMEFGEFPEEKRTAMEKKEALIEMIKEGKSNAEILEADSGYAYQIPHMDVIRQTLLEGKFRETERDLDVIYIYGDTGSGKTRCIFDQHGARNICRITSYPKDGKVNFDNYNGEDVLVFEEFHSQIPIGDMLNYLDRYPLMLPARYHDKLAMYTTVYITSNLALEEQYQAVQLQQPKVWEAFLRRIDQVHHFHKDEYHWEGENEEDYDDEFFKI